MPCRALSSALTALLRKLVKTARAEMISSPPSPFLLPAGCVSPRLPFCPPACACLAVGVGRLVHASRLSSIRISPRPYDMRGGAILLPVSVVLSRSFLLVDDGVGERVIVVDSVVLEDRGGDNPNIVVVIVKDICGLGGVNLVVPIDVHRELLDDLTNGKTLAGDIAIADGDAVGLANENVIGLDEVNGFREGVVLHYGFLSSVPFRHLKNNTTGGNYIYNSTPSQKRRKPQSRPASLPVPRVGGRGGRCLLGGVSFPVIFVQFRFAPELNIFLGIIRFICVVLLACLMAFPFSFRHPSARFPLLLVPCPLGRCHHDVICLGVVACLPFGDVPHRHSLRPSLFALRRLASSPRLFVSGDGEPTGLLACLVMS